MKVPQLAIIIVSYNTRKLLFDCLNSIRKAAKPNGGCEIVVIDNNSSDDSVSMVEEEFPEVILIKSPENLGFAAANNVAVKKVSALHYLFLNSDTVIKKYSLVKPLKFLKNHPKVGAVTIKLVTADGKLDYDNHRGLPTPWNAFCHFSKIRTLFPHSNFFNGYYLGFNKLNRVHSIPVAAGSFLMMPSKLFEKLGGWDEKFYFYGEDIDLSYRITQAGYKIVYYPKVSTLHLKGASSGLRKEGGSNSRIDKKTKIKIARATTRAMAIFYNKHFTNKYPRIIGKIVNSGIKLLEFIRVKKIIYTYHG